MANNTPPDLAEALMEEVRAERELGRRLGAYKGEWVAVREHDIVAHAPTLDDLMTQVDAASVDAVFEVAEVESAACYF